MLPLMLMIAEQASSDDTVPTSRPVTKASVGGRLVRFLRWSLTLWLITMTGWYVWSAVQTVQHPFNRGWDVRWTLVWLAVAVAVVLSHALLHRRLVTGTWLASAAVVGLAMIILSGHLMAALITLWLLALGWAWADLILDRLGIRSTAGVAERLFLTLALGVGLLGVAGLALAAAHLLTPRKTWALLALLTFVCMPTLRRGMREVRGYVRGVVARGAPASETAVLLVFLGWVGLINLAWTLAPEIQFDALNYHLAVPKIYVEQHGLVNLPYFLHSYYARLVEMLFALAVALQGQAIAKLLAFAVSVIAAAGVYSLGRVAFDRRVGLWAATLFYSTPLVSWLASTAYVDLAASMFLLAAWLAFLRWREARTAGWLTVTALLAGLAMSAKPTAVFGMPVVVLSVLGMVLVQRQAPRLARLKTLTLFAGGLGLMAALAYASVYAFTGTPFFSLLNRSLQNHVSLGPGLLTLENAYSWEMGSWRITWLSLPFALTFQSYRFAEALPAGGLGLAFVLLPLALIPLAMRRSVVTLVLALMGVYLMLWTLLIPLVYAL